MNNDANHTADTSAMSNDTHTDAVKSSGVLRDRLTMALWLLSWIPVLAYAALRAVRVLYPGFKSFKALQSRNLKQAQGMLLYLCVVTFVSGLKEFSATSLGALGQSFPWRLAIAALELLPILMGPERLYNLVIHPLFVAAEPQVDVVVDELTHVQGLAKDAISALKQADSEKLTERAADIAGVIAEDGKELMETVQSEATGVAETVRTKAAQLGWLWWKEGIVGVLEQVVSTLERTRDRVIDRVPEVAAQLQQRWKATEAIISKRTPQPLNPEEEEERPAGKKGLVQDEEDEDGELVNAEEEDEAAPGETKSSELPTECTEPRDQNEPLSESLKGELKSESELVAAESPPATQPASALRHRSKSRRDDQADSAATASTPPRSPAQKRILLAKPDPSGRSKYVPAKCESAALTGESPLQSKSLEEIARIALQEVCAAGEELRLDPAQHHPPPEKHTIQVTADSGGHKHAPISKDSVKATNKAATQQAVTHCISHANA